MNNSDYKFYSRVSLAFDLDYPAIIHSACDIIYMLYNKMLDKICYKSYLFQYIISLDKYICSYFIIPCANDLKKMSEYLIGKEIEDVSNALEDFYK